MGVCCGWGGNVAFVVCFLTVYGADVIFIASFSACCRNLLRHDARVQGIGFGAWSQLMV